MLGGRQVSFYGDTKAEALKSARAARADTERGMGRDAPTLTVERHMLDWLEMMRPSVRVSTFEAYCGHVHTWIIPHLGRLKLTDLTPAHVRKMLVTISEAGRADATVLRVRATLSSALRQAQLDYGLPRNVARLARPPKSAAPASATSSATPACRYPRATPTSCRPPSWMPWTPSPVPSAST